MVYPAIMMHTGCFVCSLYLVVSVQVTLPSALLLLLAAASSGFSIAGCLVWRAGHCRMVDVK